MKKYDVFISYAVEDKQEVASGIAAALKQKGLKIYFVSKELEPGASVSETVYAGLEKSRYCVVILSRHYIRTWPAIERSLILHRERQLNKRLIFPVRHELTPHKAAELFPELFDHYAESTEPGLDTVVENLYSSIRKRKKEDRLGVCKKTIVFACMLIVPILFFLRIINSSEPDFPSQRIIESMIHHRIITFQQHADHELAQAQAVPVKQYITLDSVNRLYNTYTAMSTYQRNSYSFTSGSENITGYANIEERIFSVPDSPHTAYGITYPCIWILNSNAQDSDFQISIAFTDTMAVGFQIDSVFQVNDAVHFWVSYNNPIRTVLYTLTYSSTDLTRRQTVRILSLKPQEEYMLNNGTGAWKLQEVK